MTRAPVMTSSEFREARTRLGFTVEQAAAQLRASPELVRAWEKGSARVPRDAAAQLRWLLAYEERRQVIAASELPTCEKLGEIGHALRTTTGDDYLYALEALEAHAEECATCRAREEYLDKHGPPLPALRLPLWMRVVGRLDELAKRLERLLRVPEGIAGDWRRTGLEMAVALSVWALMVLAVCAVIALAHGTTENDWLDLASVLVMIPMYFVGLFLIGVVCDLTRSLSRRLVGYVLRGALGVLAFYGVLGVVIPFFASDETYRDLQIALAMSTMFGVMGAIGGAGLWAWHRFTGKLDALSDEEPT